MMATIKAGEMAIAWRHFTRRNDAGILCYCAEERECVVLEMPAYVGPGSFAKIEWCSDGKRQPMPSNQLRAE